MYAIGACYESGATRYWPLDKYSRRGIPDQGWSIFRSSLAPDRNRYCKERRTLPIARHRAALLRSLPIPWRRRYYYQGVSLYRCAPALIVGEAGLKKILLPL